jgi:glycosyltransferase involved in cell wall biosynthesis
MSENYLTIIFDGSIYSLQEYGGISKYLTNLLNSLVKLKSKIKVDLLLPKPASKYFLNRKISFIPHPIYTNLLIKRFKNIINNTFLYNKNLIQIFHAPYYEKPPFNDMMSVITVHDLIYEKFPQYFPRTKDTIKFLDNIKMSIKKATSIICVSQTTKKDLEAYYDTRGKKVSVVYHGINHDIYHPENHQSIQGKDITYVGSRANYKNFPLLVKAFSKWKSKNKFRLHVVGQRLSKKELNLLKKHDISNFIITTNPKETTLVNIYQKSHALVLPSHYEGFGLPLLEAAACATLVLASDIPAHREIGEKFPMYFNPNKHEELIDALNASLSSKLRNKHIFAGIICSKKFNWSKTAAQTLQIYEDLIKS